MKLLTDVTVHAVADVGVAGVDARGTVEAGVTLTLVDVDGAVRALEARVARAVVAIHLIRARAVVARGRGTLVNVDFTVNTCQKHTRHQPLIVMCRW